MKRIEVAGLFVLLAACTGLLAAPRMFMGAWLLAWWWCLGLVLGAHANAWIHTLTGGAWGLPIKAAAHALSKRIPLLAIGLVPIALGLHVLYPWATYSGAMWMKQYSRPAFPQLWLSQNFFLARLAVYAAIWMWLARPVSYASKGRAAASLVVYVVVTSLAAVDLLMSLVPGWFSTAFGLITLAMQALSGAALSILIAARSSPASWRAIDRAVPIWRDLGNLLLMWTMVWAYVAFMEFLIIWAENLPHEIAWFVPRLQTGWAYAGIALVTGQLLLPFVALLMRHIKDNPHALSIVALVILFASMLDAAWLVLPSIDPHSMHGWWIAPLTIAGMAMLVFGSTREVFLANA